MRYLYTTLFYIAIPLILLRLAWKSRHTKGYLQRLSERFGRFEIPHTKESIWLHAVSVGEVIAAVPLIKRLQKEFPDTLIVLTTMTPTGSERAKALFEDSVFHVYVPYDIPSAIKRFLERVKPRAIIIMETEIWPNFLHICHQQNIPILLANARLSPRSAKGYGKLPKFMAQVLSNISIIAAQSQADADRFMSLGATKEQIRITGSMKFDLQIPASAHEKAAVFQSLWGNNRLVWVAASTHEGEEELVLKSFSKVLKTFPNALLVLVPRHPERFSKVTALCRKQGYQTALRSSNEACSEKVNIFIGDSMGELSAFYAASDVAFVGGSLVPTGGHNLLEPAALGIAAITGPHVFNFSEITELLLNASAIKKVDNESQLADVVIDWLEDSSKRIQAGEQGRKVVAQNRGAVDAHLQLFRSLLA